MAAGNFTLFGPFKEALGKGEINLHSDSFKAILLTNAYTPDTSNHDQLSDVTGSEVSGGNYARQSVDISVTRSGTTITVDCPDIAFGPNATITAKYCLIYDDTHADDIPVGYFDLDTTNGTASITSTNGGFDVTINASGLFTY